LHHTLLLACPPKGPSSRPRGIACALSAPLLALPPALSASRRRGARWHGLRRGCLLGTLAHLLRAGPRLGLAAGPGSGRTAGPSPRIRTPSEWRQSWKRLHRRGARADRRSRNTEQLVGARVDGAS